MISGRYTRIDFREIQKEKRTTAVRMGKPNQDSVHVVIRSVGIDKRETIEKDGKQVKNKRFGKLGYTTEETIPLFEATPKEVIEVVKKALTAAEKKS